jgi:hypothetical protein
MPISHDQNSISRDGRYIRYYKSYFSISIINSPFCSRSVTPKYKSQVEGKDKKLKELVDLSSAQASKQSEKVKQLADENKHLKAENAALKKQLIVPREAPMFEDVDEASSCGGAKKNVERVLVDLGRRSQEFKRRKDSLPLRMRLPTVLVQLIPAAKREHLVQRRSMALSRRDLREAINRSKSTSSSSLSTSISHNQRSNSSSS